MSMRDQILAAEDIETESVEVPEWGVTVQVRGMDGAGRAELMEQAIDESGDVNLRNIYPDVVIHTAYDQETGERIFAVEDRGALMAKAAKALDRVARVGMRLSGFDDDAVDEAGKGSSATPNGGTSSS